MTVYEGSMLDSQIEWKYKWRIILLLINSWITCIFQVLLLIFHNLISYASIGMITCSCWIPSRKSSMLQCNGDHKCHAKIAWHISIFQSCSILRKNWISYLMKLTMGGGRGFVLLLNCYSPNDLYRIWSISRTQKSKNRTKEMQLDYIFDFSKTSNSSISLVGLLICLWMMPQVWTEWDDRVKT